MKLEQQFFIEIEMLLKKGARKAYGENIMMCYQHSDFSSRMIEYVAVVNIAQLLLEWALPKYLQVQLEYPLRDFYNGAFPAIKWKKTNDFFNTEMISRTSHSPTKKKSRIDIAITCEPFNEGGHYISPQYKSLVGIEVKSITKGKSKIKEDIVRLSDALSLKDKIEENGIEACYSLFYRRLDNEKAVNSNSELEDKKIKELKNWKDILIDFESRYQLLKYEIEPIIIEESIIDDIAGQYPPEHFDYQEVAEKTGLIMCYLVKITKCKTN